MKRNIFFGLILASALVSCNEFNNLLKTDDYDYKYEAAKGYYADGHYSRCAAIIEDMLLLLKGSPDAEESLIMIAMCNYNMGDYETAQLYFSRYYKTYPKGKYTEVARFYSGKSLYVQSPDPRLDQTPTYTAISELQDYMDNFSYSSRRDEVNDMIFQLQDRLVQKEYNSAKLYFNLGSYIGNCFNGGNNYEACIITAENAIKSYPYTNMREELYYLILRARYQLASHSVDEKKQERYQQTIDEYFGFKNEFPESKYIKEADQIYKNSVGKTDKDLDKLVDKDTKAKEGRS